MKKLILVAVLAALAVGGFTWDDDSLPRHASSTLVAE
jgi:hypothetical protein